MPHARYDYEICVPLGIGKWKEFHVPNWEELLNGLGLVGKVMCLVPTQLLVLGLSYLWTIMALFRLLKPVRIVVFDKGLVTFFVREENFPPKSSKKRRPSYEKAPRMTGA